MDAFPTYADLVVTVATIAFLTCYVVAILVQICASKRKAGRFGLVQVAHAVAAALFGSVLSFLALYFMFGRS